MFSLHTIMKIFMILILPTTSAEDCVKISRLPPPPSNTDMFWELECEYLTTIDNAEYINKTNVPIRSIFHQNIGNNSLSQTYLLQPSNLSKLEELRLECFSTIDCAVISNISSKIFQEIPALRFLNISNNCLSSASRNTFTSMTLETLDISHNPITKLESFSLPMLKELKLDYCKINLLEKKTLHNMPLLQSLNLSNNYIRTFMNNFTSSSLQSLDISNNPLLQFVSPNFGNLSLLRVENCRLTSLEANFFYGMPILEFLNLSNNVINSFPKNFTSMTLTTLDMSYNPLEELKPSFLPELRTLCLEHCMIRDIDVNILHEMIALRFLNLSNNKIKEYPDAFTSSSIEILDLSFNYLRHISDQLVEKLPRLTYLNLRGNYLTVIEKQNLVNVMNITLHIETYLKPLSCEELCVYWSSYTEIETNEVDFIYDICIDENNESFNPNAFCNSHPVNKNVTEQNNRQPMFIMLLPAILLVISVFGCIYSLYQIQRDRAPPLPSQVAV